MDYLREKLPNLTLALGHCLTGPLAKLQIFRPVRCFPEALLFENLRLAHARHYHPDSAKMKVGDGNEVSPAEPGLSLNLLKSRPLRCHRHLARLDPCFCSVPVQVLMHAVKAGSAETIKDRYSYVGCGRVRISTTSLRGTRETRLSMPECLFSVVANCAPQRLKIRRSAHAKALRLLCFCARRTQIWSISGSSRVAIERS